ncbi:uncharacterized protein MELLADRAFT_106661 [Melampsora larici-populina 98AG31]|uniref:Secreted protein n=1 Tax=Melampsora larici-populina (strain 98AG31 / pathotype 3-4-7) TaxID=747676 RepID=F4RM81_MELLP|nr:uncharacterized protein MELLADRAFT_106661 [Melampsora larici-populina 98AG31]EGG06375.1 hypothetical protein MELLADRAFT_106661 [Melampsora larici-populina 98AG31]
MFHQPATLAVAVLVSTLCLNALIVSYTETFGYRYKCTHGSTGVFSPAPVVDVGYQVVSMKNCRELEADPTDPKSSDQICLDYMRLDDTKFSSACTQKVTLPPASGTGKSCIRNLHPISDERILSFLAFTDCSKEFTEIILMFWYISLRSKVSLGGGVRRGVICGQAASVGQ